MAQAIVLRAHGGPEQLKLEEIEIGAPGVGQIRLRQTAIGVNYIDTYIRTGLYRTLALPGIPGTEATGVIEQVGGGVDWLAPGDRVAYAGGGFGSYASERLLDAQLAIPLPGDIDDRLAARVLMKALTVAVLVQDVHPVRPGATVLVHAAAGGVGQLLAQWAASLGADVIGTAGSPEKAEVARRSGCREVILYREVDFAERVLALTGGTGVEIVFDAVGKDTFDGSLRSIATCGHLVSYGQASGPIPPLEIARLIPKSGTISRPTWGHYAQTREKRLALAEAVFDRLRRGVLAPEGGDIFPLARAADAHRSIENRGPPAILIP